MLAILAAVVGQAPAAWGTDSAADDKKVLLVLNRLTYGPTPEMVETVRRLGPEAFIAAQLAPEAHPELADPPWLAERLARLSTTGLGAVALFRQHGPDPGPDGVIGPEDLMAARERTERVAMEQAEARLLRAVAAPAQLRELLIDFWTRHFRLDMGKGLVRLWAGAFVREAVAPRALGRFADLLLAASSHPAMLLSHEALKNSHAPDGAEPGHGPDATLATAILRRHALGPDTPVGERDITALTAVLTGWRLGARPDDESGTGFVFDPKRHDPRDKVLFGRTIPGGGWPEGEQAMHVLAEHPAAAGYICRELAVYFAADDPPPELLGRCAATFTASRGDISVVLAGMLSDPEFWDETLCPPRFKTAWRYAASAARAAGTRDFRAEPLLAALCRAGAAPGFERSADNPVDRPTARGLAWRLALAKGLCGGDIPVFEQPGPTPLLSPARLTEALPGLFSDKAQKIAREAKADGGAVLLAAPEFLSR